MVKCLANAKERESGLESKIS
jgi:hypothetical protein